MAILSVMRSAAVVVDEHFNVFEDNWAHIPATLDDRTFSISGATPRQLLFRDRQDGERVRQVIGSMIAKANSRLVEFVVLRTQSGSLRCVVHIIPLVDYEPSAPGNGIQTGKHFFMMVWRRLPLERSTNFEALTREFGLTRAEGLIVEAIGRGLTLEEFAETKGIAHVTARNQLRNACAKLGLGRQAEIAALYAEISLFWPVKDWAVNRNSSGIAVASAPRT
jgi:DNA-binding CsgD family transcriptional regulator